MAPAVNIVLRADGRVEHLPAKPTMAQARELIGADTLDGFSLRDGRYMLLDDAGHARGLLFNKAATELYHSICKPGTTHFIVGDAVVIAEDAEC